MNDKSQQQNIMYEDNNSQHHSYSAMMINPNEQKIPTSQYNKFLINQALQERRQKLQSRIYQTNINKQYMQKQAFPFGKQSTKISNYVVKQMSKDQENNRILQKFRLQAIKNRNQKYGKHLGVLPYVTESMLPGVNVDASKFIEKPKIPSSANYKVPQNLKPYSLDNSPIKKYHTINHDKKSIGIQTEQSQFVLPKKKKRMMPFIDKEDQTLRNIKKMLKGINHKIHQNSLDISENLQQLQLRSKQIHKSPKARQYEDEDYNINKKPKIEYMNNYRTESMKNNLKRSDDQFQDRKILKIKDHLKLLKRNRQRLDNINKYS